MGHGDVLGDESGTGEASADRTGDGAQGDRTGEHALDGGSRDGVPDGGSASDGLRILHVDDDETVRSRVAAFVDREYDDVTVDGTADTGEAESRLEAGAVDVLLLEPDAGGVDAERLLDAASVPVVFYTRVDPGAMPERVFAAADTFVEKWTAEEGIAFVVEKVLWTVREAETPSRLARALDPVDEGETGSCQFLLYEDGTPVWESEPLASFFEERGVTVPVPETPDFYRKLGAVLSHDPETVRAVRTDGTVDATEFTLPAADGEAKFRYVEHEFPDLPGPVHLVVVEDVTQRYRDGARRELLALLDEHVQDGISVVDADGRIEYHNASFASLLGYDDMVGTHSASYMAAGELERGQRAVQRLLGSGADSEVLDMEFVTADGERRTLAVHFAPRHSNGEYAGLVNVARDISERRERERELERYRALVENAGDPMFVTDADCRIVRSNEAMSRLFFAAESSLAGTELADLFPADGIDRLATAMERARDTGESATCELRLPDVTDDERRFEATVAALPGDERADFAAILHEVTERERRESELDLLKQVLARVLRHDIRTGLTVVRGQAEVLAERTAGEEREMAETIVDRSEGLVETVEKARAIERVIDSDDGQVVMDLRTVVNRVVANVAAAYPDATYETAISERVPVSVHEAFPYAVENLIENAVEHSSTNPRSSSTREDAVEHSSTNPSPDAGPGVETEAGTGAEAGSGADDAVSPVDEIDHAAMATDSQARAERRDGPTVTISSTVDEETVALHVADDGPGISETELEVLDEREETPLKHGTGVGLWLVDWVVDHSGGDLTFDTGDEGTTVTVRVDRGNPGAVDADGPE